MKRDCMKRDCILIKEKPSQSIFWSILMFLSLGMGIAIFYEATGERKYWINRWRLWRALRAGRVRLEREDGLTTNMWMMWIDDRRYVLHIFTKDNPDSPASVYLSGSSWIIKDDNFTVSEWKKVGGMYMGDSMIGLFNGSLITNFLRRSSYRMLLELADPAKVRDKKLEKLGI